MIFGAILAGGVGNRMKADKPKQFLPLGDRPILIHTVEQFLRCKVLDELYIAVHREWLTYTEELLNTHLPDRSKTVRIVAGGDDRNSTLFAVVDAIEREYGEDEAHLLVTHDAVRPFVTPSMIERTVDLAAQYGAAEVAIAAVDTTVISTDGETITHTPDRRTVYQIQTPQTFRMGELKRAFDSLSEDEKQGLTDGASIFTAVGRPVHLTEGARFNIKITTPEDLVLAKAILNSLS